MIKRVLLIPILLSLFVGCYNSPNNLVDSQMHSEITDSIWGKKRQKELRKIVSFTDKYITKKVNEKDINKAYHLYLDSLYRQVLRGNRKAIGLGIKEERKVSFLKKLGKKTYQEIWTVAKSSKSGSKDAFYDRIINNQGLIVEYVEALSKKNENYIGLHEGFLYLGDVPPSFLAGFITNHTKFDFNKFDNRLILAVMFFSIYEADHPAYSPR